jgi:hypothetical protein
MVELENNVDKGYFFIDYIDGIIILLHKSIKDHGLARKNKYCLMLIKILEINGLKFRNSSKEGKKIIIKN